MTILRKTLLLLAASHLLSGCNLMSQLDKTNEIVQAKYLSIKEWDQLPLRYISWRQAMAMIQLSNSQIKSADSSLREAKRSSQQVYTDLIPGVSYYGTFTKTIEELINLSSYGGSDLSSNLNVSFYLPTLTQLPYRVYSAKAREFAAVKAREGVEREVVSKLYKLIRGREIDEALIALNDTNYTPEHLRENEELKKKHAAESADTSYWQAVADTLGNREARWVILPETMPHVDWADYEKKLGKLDPLVVTSFSLKIEQARLQQYGIALNYLPTINTSLYSPALFSSTGGTYSGTFLSSEDTTLNLSISYRLDTKMTDWNRFLTNQENYEKVCREVVLDLMDRRVKLKTLRRSIDDYRSWQGYMKKRMAFLLKKTPRSSAEYLERNQLITALKRELLSQEKSALESEAAIILEYGLPKSR